MENKGTTHDEWREMINKWSEFCGKTASITAPAWKQQRDCIHNALVRMGKWIAENSEG